MKKTCFILSNVVFPSEIKSGTVDFFRGLADLIFKKDRSKESRNLFDFDGGDSSKSLLPPG